MSLIQLGKGTFRVGSGGGGSTPVAVIGAIETLIVDNAGSVPEGKWYVYIVNTGGGAGLANGKTLDVGEGNTFFQGYLDSANETFVRSPEITYDASGTTFKIQIQD